MALDGCETCIQSDLKNCGTCGMKCPSATNARATCAEGKCGLSCARYFADCDKLSGNGCEVDIRNHIFHVKHCGGCSNRCVTAVANSSATCNGGVCSFTCNSGFKNCNGTCLQTMTDPNNCGACGLICKGNLESNCNNRTPQCGSCEAGGCKLDIPSSLEFDAFDHSTYFEFPTRGSGFIKFTLSNLTLPDNYPDQFFVGFYEEVGSDLARSIRLFYLEFTNDFVAFWSASPERAAGWETGLLNGPNDIWISVGRDSVVRVGQGTSVGAPGTFLEAQYDANKTASIKYVLFYNLVPIGTDPVSMTNVVVGNWAPYPRLVRDRSEDRSKLLESIIQYSMPDRSGLETTQAQCA